MRLSVFAACLVAGLSCGAILPASGSETAMAAYDDTWYRGEFWGGEYPDGLSVTQDTEIAIRADTDLTLARDIACTLPKNATYHLWNSDRVESDKLVFVAFSKITPATITKDFNTVLDDEQGENSFDVNFRKGETYRYLTYFSEGAFLIEYKGVHYIAYDNLWEVTDFGAEEALVHEWLGLTCANGNSGWLFMDEARDLPGIEPARVWQWGWALDLDAPEPVLDENGDRVE